MGSRTAFFYGTLMAREILFRVIYGDGQVARDPAKALLASLLTIRPATLHDHCRHRVRNVDYPGVTPQEGYSVRGTFVTGLTDGDIARLDMFEGNEYTRKFVQVKVDGEEEEMKAEIYMYTAGAVYLEKKEWDYEEFRKEKMHRWTGASPEFQDIDEFVEGVPTNTNTNTSLQDPPGSQYTSSQYETVVEDEEALKATV